MNRRTILWLVPIAMAAAALWLLGGERMAPATPRSADAAPAEAPEAASLATASAGTTAPAVEARGDGAPKAGSDPRVALPPGSAVIRGRCVDELAAPLAGVQVTLRGWGSDSTRVARHRLDHGEVVWHDPDAIVTPDDGSFEFRFDPPPPFQFRIDATAIGRVRIQARWGELARDATVDLGDVVLPPGVLVRGRVVDGDGAGVARVQLHLQNVDATRYSRPGTPRVRDSGSARTDTGGWFDTDDPIAPGRWKIEVYGRVVREPGQAIELALPSADLRVVVAPSGAARPAISGIVVDPSGAPLPGVRVSTQGRMAETSTAHDGTFRLFQAIPTASLRTAQAPTRIVFAGEGLTHHTSAEPIAWGTGDLRVVLERGPSLTLRVRRADDGTPVERFGITLESIGPEGGYHSRDGELEHIGDHPGGVLRIAHATTGRFRLVVQPAQSTGLPTSAPQEIDVTAGVAQTIDVALTAFATRQVLVVTGADAPLAGARVELLEHQNGGLVTLSMSAAPEDIARTRSNDHVAILHHAATTDAAGSVTVTGRVGADHALRLAGPGHVPIVVQPFRVEIAEPARIVVSGGATLHGRITPVELVAALRVDAGLSESGNLAANEKRYAPGIRLDGLGERSGESLPSGPLACAPIASDGSFVVAGIPPGTWNVVLTAWSARIDLGVATSQGSRDRVVHARLTLADGEQRELALALAQWLPQTVELRVRMGGSPFHGRVSLHGRIAATLDGRSEHHIVGTDRDGHATVRLPHGTWSAIVVVPIDKGHATIAAPPFEVHAGTHSIEVDLRRASRSIVVLDLEGAPAANLALWVRASGAEAFAEAFAAFEQTTTDAAGRVTLHGTLGTVDLRARRRAFTDDAALAAWMRDHGDDPARGHATLVDLGTVELFAGESPEQVVRLPREWTELPK